MGALRVVLVAEESAGIQVLRRLAGSPHELTAVVTQPPSRGGGATVESVARTLGVEVLPAASMRDPGFAHWLRGREVDLLLNVHSLEIIDAAVLAAPRIGSFNLHPGPLPEYAGLSVPSWAIYNGETGHGVTVHWMEPEIDTGAIAYAEPVELTARDTGLSLSVKCIKAGVPLVSRLLAAAAAGSQAIPRVPQDLARRRYYRRGAPDGGKLRWWRPAREVADLVRASDYAPFPSPWGTPVTSWDGVHVGVVRVERTGEPFSGEPGSVGRIDESAAMVGTADEWVRVLRLRVGEATVAASSLLREGGRFGDV